MRFYTSGSVQCGFPGAANVAAVALLWLLALPANAANAADDIRMENLELSSDTIVPIDLEPPLIDHEALISGLAGEVQTFSALVRDERGVESVQFFFRMESTGDFASIPMRLIPGTSNFVVTIETAGHHRTVEYYIEARDTGGNRVLKGFPSRPLERQLSAPAVSAAGAPDEPMSTQANRPRWLYVLLGVAAAGLLLSRSGGDGGGEATVPMVPLTITASQP